MSIEHSTSEVLPPVEVSSSPMQRLEEYLQMRGQRMTAQRRSMVEQIFDRHDHFDADALIEQLRQSDVFKGTVSQATV
ncbi:MAG: transcriptional repressor, partial [Planctomycetota bacterium]